MDTVLLAQSIAETRRVADHSVATAIGVAPLAKYHFSMLNDKARNKAFAAAIQKAVIRRQPSLVLDIGAGTGLLAVLAARAGAPRVYAIEMATEMADVAIDVVANNNMTHAVRVVSSHSSRVCLGDGVATNVGIPPSKIEPWVRKADLLICEILGTDPLCGGLLPTLRDARSRLLHPDAVVIPSGIEVHATIVQSDELIMLNAANNPAGGLDVSAFSVLSHRTRPIRLSEVDHVQLTAPRVALRLRLDSLEGPSASGETELEFTVEQPGVAHAVVAWFTCHLDDDISFSTAPGVAEPMRGYTWGQLAHFLPPSPVTAGEAIRLRTEWSDKGLRFFSMRQRDDNRGPRIKPPPPMGRLANVKGRSLWQIARREKMRRERKAVLSAEEERKQQIVQRLSNIESFEKQMEYRKKHHLNQNGFSTSALS